MMYIDLDLLEPYITDEWMEKAEKAYQHVKALPPDERARAIDTYSHIWGCLKDALETVSHGKCWYCESREARGDKDVDHHRPKNAVKGYKGATDSIGYWWLAFVWVNYRYSCIYCNQRRKDRKQKNSPTGGKGCYFPLVDETKRIASECRLGDLLLCEESALLDPTIATDPDLLTFDAAGRAMPASNDSIEQLRAETSIDLYNLNHTDLKEKRRVVVCRNVRNLLEEGDMFYAAYDRDKSNLLAREGYRRVVKKLKYMISERGEYSAAAKAMLRANRYYPWVEVILTGQK
jgi:uncharacterized protein (TIGR02646 family)